MRTSTALLWWCTAAVLLLPGVVAAEPYFAPRHVVDPARPKSEGEPDISQPFLFLEPHDGCYDLRQPLTVTIYAVNRSGNPMLIEWRAIVESLSLEAVGPGSATPLPARPQPESRELKKRGFSSMTFDLKDIFKINGASVYRLAYSRPLKDGRIHVAGPVTFLVEDAAAIDKLAGAIDVGPVRDMVAELLKGNPLFATGAQLKTYSDDAQIWDDPQMEGIRWASNVGEKSRRWEEAFKQLAVPDAPAVNTRALELLIDRSLFVSDNLRVPLDDRAYYWLIRPIDENLSLDVRERTHLKFARSRDAWVVSQSIGRLMGLECVDRYHEPLTHSVPALDLLFAIADGPDKQLAMEAIGSLSSYRHDPKITQFLRRKMRDADGALALEAAIVTCYSGDWSGFPVLLRCTRSDDPELRLEAIAQLVDIRFQKHSAKVVPLLLAELTQPLSDKHLERAVESLQTYPSAEVVEAVTQLLEHKNLQVRRRSQLTLDTIQREMKRNPKNR